MILSSHHAELNLDIIFTLLWNIWKSRNDILFIKKIWSLMQVICATKAMLNGGVLEEKEEVNTQLIGNNVSSFVETNSQTQTADPTFYTDVAYNLDMDTDEAGIVILLKEEFINHTIFVQASAKNVSFVVQVEALGLALAAKIVKALGWNSATFFSECRNLVEVVKERNLFEKLEH